MGPHLLPAMALLKDMEPFMAPIQAFSALSDSYEAEFAHALIEVEAEEGPGSESSYSWTSAYGFSNQPESNKKEESVALCDTGLC